MTPLFYLYARRRGSAETTLVAEARPCSRGYWPEVWEELLKGYDADGYDSWVRWACKDRDGHVTLGDVWRDYRRFG